MISPIASELAEAVALLDPPSVRATPGAHGLDYHERSYPCR